VRIRVARPAFGARTPIASSERQIAEGLLSGKVQLGSFPTWTWETEGVNSFRALEAPLLISDFALMNKVVGSAIAREMLASTEDRGVVGLGLVPDNLRRLLVRDRRFVSPAGLMRARVLVRSTAMGQIANALGATAVTDEGDDSHLALQQGRVDAADEALPRSFGDGYSDVAKYAWSNVALFPRINVIAINRKVFDELTGTEQAALHLAARDAAGEAANHLTEGEDVAAEGLCESGLRFARASRGQLTELTAALRAVTAALERDGQTRRFIERIATLKSATPPGPELAIPHGCAA
jgi:TRAP-type C4-dicarboxylate transport system substrate-binding protein